MASTYTLRMNEGNSADSHSSALEELWRTHYRQILQIAYRITNNREDAEDALQDSFLRAHVHLHTFDGRSSIKTWLTSIAINSALMIRRKRANAPVHSSFDEISESGSESRVLNQDSRSESPDTQYAQLERQEMVRQAIAVLRPSIREAIELQTTEERSVKEVAGIMGLSITATKSRIFQAKKALRKALKRKLGRRWTKTRQLQMSVA